ncbi:MAG TPA: AsmA family protein, partial [Bryobacteraceae bacterium]|nr:AsmA family protein [Bryobacteraceae bacterium]
MNRAFRWGAAALLAFVAAALVAPFIRVDQYKEQIRAGLQRALHRKVDIWGEAHLTLFRGPGFSVEQVVIHDDPALGLEPLASVPELQTTVSLYSLWTGKLEFSSV